MVKGVSILLGSTPLAACGALDADGNGVVTTDELTVAVNNGLNGCPRCPH